MKPEQTKACLTAIKAACMALGADITPEQTDAGKMAEGLAYAVARVMNTENNLKVLCAKARGHFEQVPA